MSVGSEKIYVLSVQKMENEEENLSIYRALAAKYMEVGVVDLNSGKCTFLRSSFDTLTGKSLYKISDLAERISEKVRLELIHSDDVAEYLRLTSVETLKNRLVAGEPISTTIRYRVREGFVRCTFEVTRISGDGLKALITVKKSESSRGVCIMDEEYRRELEAAANTDRLTGLYNRYYYDRYLSSLRITGCSVGLVFCDLNALKHANDNYGHEAGDRMIVEFAGLLKRVVPTMLCFRWSGDEFMAVASGTDEKSFTEQVGLIRAECAKSTPTVASVGASFTEKCDNVDRLAALAEQDMYVEKRRFYLENPHLKR